MLQGTRRAPDEVIGDIPPNLAPCTVEKAAINAVMAGCTPDDFPVVLAALGPTLIPDFTMHGLLGPDYSAVPAGGVDAPGGTAIDKNWGGHAPQKGKRLPAHHGLPPQPAQRTHT